VAHVLTDYDIVPIHELSNCSSGRDTYRLAGFGVDTLHSLTGRTADHRAIRAAPQAGGLCDED
jgi:hypothetical protein